MTDREIEKAVDDVVDAVDFTAPVEVEDVQHVHDLLRARLPAELSLDSHHRIRDVVFEVRRGHNLLYRVQKQVIL